MANEDTLMAVAVIQRVELTADGTQTVYEVRRNSTDEGLMYASLDVDETLRYLRSLLTGEAGS